MLFNANNGKILLIEKITFAKQPGRYEEEIGVFIMDYRQNSPAVRRNPFTVASMIMGICSLLTICTAILPLPLGALGILFAILSYRKGRQMDTMAVTGIATSCVGLLFSLAVVGMAFAMMPSMLRDPEYRDMLNRYYESVYGQSYDDLFENAYGIDLDELFPTE